MKYLIILTVLNNGNFLTLYKQCMTVKSRILGQLSTFIYKKHKALLGAALA